MTARVDSNGREGTTMNATLLKAGDMVLAFHPRMLGVVKHGTVVKFGRKYVYVDFGQLAGGTFKVAPRDVVEIVG